MKFDEIYDKMNQLGWISKDCSKLNLALYYFSAIYTPYEPEELRIAGLPIPDEAGEIQLENPIYSELVDIARQDVVDYLIWAGSTIDPFIPAGETK